MSLIAATSTKASLTVRCRLDKHPYPGDAKVTAAQMATIQLTPQPFYGGLELYDPPSREA